MSGHRWSLRAAFPALCLLLGCAVGCLQEPEGRQRVVEALGPARLVEGRLSGFPHVPLGERFEVPVRRVASLSEELKRQRTPEAAADRGVLLLVDPRYREGAVALLEVARKGAPRDPRIASDLAAAYLAKSGGPGNPESVRDLFYALDAAGTAVDLAPDLPEAQFNLALALEKLCLQDEAARAWSAFLTLDSSSGWEVEARAHLKALGRQSRASDWEAVRPKLETAALAGDQRVVRRIVKAQRLRSRFFGEQVLLPRWAEARMAGDVHGAGTALTMARAVGEALAELAGDEMLKDAVTAIDRAAAQPERLAGLVRGHRRYAQAARSYAQFDRKTAAEGFAVAENELAKAGSPFHLWAALFSAACDYQASHYQDALSGLDALERSGKGKYANLIGRAEWIRGLILLVMEQPLASRESFGAAIAAFERTGELGHQAAAHALMVESASFLGEERETWFHLGRALALADDLVEPRNRQMIAIIATQAVLQGDLPRAGLYLQNEGVRWALAEGNPIQVAYALHDRAKLDFFGGREREAKQDAAAAGHWAARAGDDALRADILLLEARILAKDDIQAALAKLNAAFPLLHRTQYVRSLSSSYLLRGRLYTRLERRDLAAADFRAGIEQLEHTFGALDDSSRLPFLDRGSELFDEMVRLSMESEARPWPKAFSYVERGRARALAKLMARDRAEQRALGLEQVKKELPPGRVLVEYAVLPERLLAWVIEGGRLRSFSQPIGTVEIQKRIHRLTSRIAAGESVDQEVSDLYRILIAPAGLPASAGLVIVPDKSLQELPWGLLQDRTRGRPLIVDHTIEVTPSASFYLRSMARTRRGHRDPAPVLVVADPAFDRALAQDLPRLPQAAAEAAEITRLYGRADVLQGEEATRARALAALGAHRIVHFGVHFRIDGRSSGFSNILLAPESGDPGVLFARDLYQWSFPATELVVLSGCESAGGQVAGSEAVASLARPFLAAGIPGVIGNLWRIDDHAAKQFAIGLHRTLAAGESAAVALQRAQIAMLRSGDPALAAPRSWAGFTFYSRAGAPRGR